MLDFAPELLNGQPEMRHVLLAYREAIEPTPQGDSEFSDLLAKGFRPRLKAVDGVPSENMTRIHGKLIAHGLLQVEIASRTGGMLYQLTSLGRQACLRLSRVSVEDCDSDVEECESSTDEELVELAIG